MSDTNATLNDPQTALQNLHNGVFADAFFRKLASAYGIAPHTEEEAATLLQMGQQLLQTHEAVEREKTAQVRSQNRFEAANALMREALGQASPSLAKQADDEWAARYARDVANIPEVYNDALAWQVGQARLISEAL